MLIASALASGISLLAAAMLAYIALYDFRHLKIRNSAVLALLLLYAVRSVLLGFAGLSGDLMAGAFLFIISFVMWLLRMMGAGDVKLYFALGVFIGFDLLAPYAFALLLVSILFVLALILSARITTNAGIVGRLKGFRTSGKAPYAVPMSIAGVPVIVARAFGELVRNGLL